jgi:hypothetical protein
MAGRAKDPAALRALDQTMQAELRRLRPDLLGATVGWYGDREFIQTSYFTSLADARTNERSMAETELCARFMGQVDGELRFYDLEAPQFA